jgi:hypothetical protein
MAKGGVQPGAPGDQPVLQLQLDEGEGEADKPHLEAEHLAHYFRNAAGVASLIDPKTGNPRHPRIEWA